VHAAVAVDVRRQRHLRVRRQVLERQLQCETRA
jgi:hypothetical protein